MSKYPRTRYTKGVPRNFITAGGKDFYFNWEDIDKFKFIVLKDAMAHMGYPATMILPIGPAIPGTPLGTPDRPISDFDEDYEADHMMILKPGTTPVYFSSEEIDVEDFWIELADRWGKELTRYYNPKDPEWVKKHGDEIDEENEEEEGLCPHCDVELDSLTLHGGREVKYQCPECGEQFDERYGN